MARVTLTFEDQDGKIFFGADYCGFPQSDSPAHKVASQVIMWLDHQAVEKINLAVDTEPTDKIQNGGEPEYWVPKDENPLWVPGKVE